MLKAYCNLNFKPASLDAVGRLTRSDIDRILDSLNDRDAYGNVSSSNFDLAMNDTGSGRPYDIIIAVREHELPYYKKTKEERKKDPLANTIRGVLFGHVASVDDYEAINRSRPPQKLAKTFPMMLRVINYNKNLIIIDGFSNMTRYKDAVMLDFLLRKLQESMFGSNMAVICMPGTRIDGQLGGELIKFGFRPLSLSSYDDMYAPGDLAGQCSLMVTMRTRDSRENGQQ